MTAALSGYPAGILTGQQVYRLFRQLSTAGIALPAVNVVDSNGINGVLEAARAARSPAIVQFSYGGSAFLAGKSIDNTQYQASILGAQAGVAYLDKIAKTYGVPVIAHTDHAARALLPWVDGLLQAEAQAFSKTGKALFSSHMIDLSKEPLKENIELCCRYLERMSALDLFLEIEVGCTGGEEDGVDNRHLSAQHLYTSVEDVIYAYEKLKQISPLFSIAASFGNVHGVYAPGNVVLKPSLLKDCQQGISEKFGFGQKPLLLVFHGSSGSCDAALKEAVQYGVVKVNMDTDTQWASWEGLLHYYQTHADYLQGQLGNPKGADQPNKNYYDPRSWQRAAQKSFVARIQKAFDVLGSTGSLQEIASSE